MNNPPPNDKTGDELVASHAELIGRVALVWNDVQAEVGLLFEEFCTAAEVRKQYWEIKNDRAQRKMLLSEGSFALQEYADLWERLEKTLAAIDQLAQGRNAAIHTYWAVDWPAGKISPHRQVPSHRRLRPDFEAQFNELLKELSDHWRSPARAATGIVTRLFRNCLTKPNPFDSTSAARISRHPAAGPARFDRVHGRLSSRTCR